MTYKELYYFVGHCLALDENPAFRDELLEAIRNDTIDWEAFVQLCSDQLMIPAIYLKFKNHRILDKLPEELVQAFQEIYELNRERNQQILIQIDEICALLHAENIFPVFLKGTANLLDGLYSDPGERMIHDIDFLVQEEEYLKVAEVLMKNGYGHGEKNCYVDYKFRKHYPTMVQYGKPAPIEIHRSLLSEKYSDQLHPELVNRQKQTVAGKQQIYVPSDRHKLMHTFLHSQLEDQGHVYQQASFRGFYDLNALANRIEPNLSDEFTDYRKQFICWLTLSDRISGTNRYESIPETQLAESYCRYYDWTLKHWRIHRIIVLTKKLGHLILVRYIGGFAQLIVSSKQRTFMYRRLSSSEWYSNHWSHYKSYFS